MRLNDRICRRYLLETSSNEDNKETCIGYKMLRQPSGSQPGQFQLVELHYVVVDGFGEWSERTLAGVVEAYSVDTIPMHYKRMAKNHIHNLLANGYVFEDETLFNAEKLVVRELAACDTVITGDGPSVSWLMDPKPGSNLAMKLQNGFIRGVFNEGAELIGFETGNDVLMSIDTLLMRTDTQFVLRLATGFAENTIDPETLKGAGEILPEHGHKPLLMLIYLQKQFETVFTSLADTGVLVSLCDEHGNAIEVEPFSALEGLIERFGFDYDAVRADAVKLGIAQELIRLSDIEAEQDDCFF